MRRALAAFVLLVSSAGCLPDRNNPQDPVNRPTAVASIVRDGAIVGVTGRDQPVLLVASNSTPADHGLLVTWEHRRVGTADWSLVAGPVPIASPVTFDPADHVDGYTTNGDLSSAAWELRATVDDPVTGGSDAQVVGLAVLNDPPEFLGRVQWEFPPGGRWWTEPVQPWIVELPAEFAGDEALPLTYSWTRVFGPETALTTNEENGTATLEVPLFESESLFRVTATDADGATTAVDVRVYVREQLWTTSFTGVTTRQVEPPIDYLFPNDGDGQPVEGIVFAAGDGVWTFEYGRDELSGNTTEPYIVHRTHGMKGDGGYETVLPTGSELRASATDPSGIGGWMVAEEPGGDLRFYRVGDATQIPAAEITVPAAMGSLLDPFEVDYESLSLAAKQNGAGAWYLRVDGGVELVELDADGTELGATPIDTGGDAIGLAAAGGGDVWVLTGNGDQVVPPPLRLDRYAPGRVLAETRSLPFADETAPRAFAYQHTTGRFALSGYRAVGDTPFIALVESDGNVLFDLDQIHLPDRIVFDPRIDSVWTVSGYLLAAREILPDGTIASNVSFTAAPRGFVIDSETGGRWAGGARLARSTPFALEGEHASNAIPFPVEVRLDPARARALVRDGNVHDVTVLDPEAVVLERFAIASLVNSESASIGAMTVNPADGTLWLASGYDEVVLGASRIFAIPRPGATGCPESGLPYDACEVAEEELEDLGIVSSIDVDPVTGELCVLGSSAGTERLMRFSPDGTRLWSYTSPFDYTHETASLIGEDACALLGGMLNGGSSFKVDSVARIVNGASTGQYNFFQGSTITQLSALHGNRAHAYQHISNFRYVIEIYFTSGFCTAPCSTLRTDTSNLATDSVEAYAVDPVYGGVYAAADGPGLPGTLLRFGDSANRTTGELPLNAPLDVAVNR